MDKLHEIEEALIKANNDDPFTLISLNFASNKEILMLIEDPRISEEYRQALNKYLGARNLEKLIAGD